MSVKKMDINDLPMKPIAVPYWLFTEHGIAPLSVVVYGYLLVKIQGRPFIMATAGEIAEGLGISSATLSRALRELRTLKIIQTSLVYDRTTLGCVGTEFRVTKSETPPWIEAAR